MARYIKTDSSEAGNGVDHADTEGHIRILDDTEAEGARRKVDHADTEGHIRVLDDFEAEDTRRVGLDDVDA